MPSATLLLAAEPDQVILPTVYDFLSRYGIQPCDAQEYSISAGRFARIEWPVDDQTNKVGAELELFDKDFSAIARAFSFQYSISFSDAPFRVGLYCPGFNGSLEQILHRYSPVSDNNMQVVFVIGDHPDLQASANRYGIPYYDIQSSEGLMREAQFLQFISRHKPDLFGMMPPVENLSASLLEKLPCPVLAVSEAVVPSNVPGMVFEAKLAGAGVLLASAFLLQADVNQSQLVLQHAKPVVQKQNKKCDFLTSGSEQRDLEIEVLVRALAKFTYHKVIVYKQYLYTFD